MKYTDKRFSVSLTAEPKKMTTVCKIEGHAWADRYGKCVRCGEKIRAVGFTTFKSFNTDEGEE